ncbi:MAG: helix-turn-helix domain-containing protein, partial [Clostridiales Family XIII bacterium]|jgi:two-component system response regulator YesN|nr:helix-turn-helix domain-containing protein [Clostridiales Family XIII bacterium]
MKPIDAEELSNVLRRISHTLRRETAERLDIERIRRSYEESLPLLRQQLLSQLISGGTVDRELLTEAGLDFNAERYGVAVIKFNVQDATRELSRDETRLLPLSLQQLITDNLEEQSDFHLIHFPDHIVLLMLMSKDEGMRDMLHMLSRLVTPSLKLLNLKLYIGVGKSRTRTEDVYLSYEEALDALEYSRSLDDGQVMYIGDIVPGRRRGNHRLSTFINEIQKCVMTGNRERLEKAVDALTADFAQHPPTRLQYDYFLFELGAELNRLIQIYELDYDEDSNLVDALLRKKYSRDFDAGVLKTAIMACADLIRKKIKTKRKDSTSQLVADAQAFISEHYADPTLSLDQLCKALNVSQSYFSSVFKKAMGSSFVSRLTEVRMQAAAALLEATDLKTYAIAEKVGYADSNYFSYVFKKHVGLSPTVYRAERLKDME